MLNFCDFIQAYIFTTNHHLNRGGHLDRFYCIMKSLEYNLLLTAQSQSSSTVISM